MADGLFPDFESGGAEQGGKIPVHTLERDEKPDVFPLHHLEGTAGVMGPVEQEGTPHGVGNAGGGPFLPGVTPRGADATGEIGAAGADQLQQGGKVGGIVLAVPIHHGRKRPATGEEPGVESRALAKIAWKVDDADAFFPVEQGGSAVPTAVIHRDDLRTGDGGAGLRQDRGNVFLLVEEGDDKGEVGGHGLFPEKQGRHP